MADAESLEDIILEMAKDAYENDRGWAYEGGGGRDFEATVTIDVYIEEARALCARIIAASSK